MRNVQRPWYSSGAHPQTQSRPVGSDRRTRNGRAEPRSEWPRVCVRWGGFETFSRFDHVGVLPTSRKPSNTTVFSPGRWQSGWFLQRRLSECRCIPESRTHGTTSWWTCCVSNLKGVLDATLDWASMSTFFKACTLPPDEPERACFRTLSMGNFVESTKPSFVIQGSFLSRFSGFMIESPSMGCLLSDEYIVIIAKAG